MSRRSDWHTLRERRMAEPGAVDAYEAARLAFELGRRVRELREQRGWNQTQLAHEAGMTQSAVARFEAGGTIPTLPVLERLARALDAELDVKLTPKPAPA
jgi:ribosome-binding protein aMBF1 (putative translation factor)